MEVGLGLLRMPDFVAVAHVTDIPADLPPLHPEEAAFMSKRSVKSRRRSYVMGRVAAHHALAVLGEDSGPIGRGELGEPLWPRGVAGSITHAAGQVVAAAARLTDCAGIGVDLEDSGRFFPQLIEHIAFGREAERLLALDGNAQRRATIELFAAKEAIYKAFFTRVGEFFGFASAEIQPVAADEYEGRLVRPLDPDYPADRTFRITTSWSGDLVMAGVALPV